MVGLGEYVEQKLDMEAHVCDEPQMAVILGAGRAIGNPATLKKIKMEF